MLSRVRGLLRAVPVLRRQRQPDPRAPGHLRPGRVLLRVRLLPLRQVTLTVCQVYVYVSLYPMLFMFNLGILLQFTLES